MTLTPLGEIGSTLRSHCAALKYLIALYCDADLIQRRQDWPKALPSIRGGAAILFHFCPYFLIACMLVRPLLHGELGLLSGFPFIAHDFPTQGGGSSTNVSPRVGAASLETTGTGQVPDEPRSTNAAQRPVAMNPGPAKPGETTNAHETPITTHATKIAAALGVSVAFAVVFGFLVGAAYDVGRGLIWGLTIGVIGGFAGAFGSGLHVGVTLALIVGFAIGLTASLIVARHHPVMGGLVAAVGAAIASLVILDSGGGAEECAGVGMGAILAYFRAYYQVLHGAVSSAPRTLAPIHPLLWDRNCMIPFPRLDAFLVSYTEQFPAPGRALIESLIENSTSYKWSAIHAKTITVARAAAKVANLGDLAHAASALPSGSRGFLVEVPSVQRSLIAISRQQLRVETTDRPFFRERSLEALRAEINAFSSEVRGYREPLATEFRRAAAMWLKLAERQLDEVQSQWRREPTPQVFRAGDPVQRDTEAFVARMEVVGALENEALADTGCPGILLYGGRRLGKSTVIRNLDGFLPESVIPVVVSMQDPRAFTSEATLTALLGAEIRNRYARAAKVDTEPKDLITLFEFLQKCNAELQKESRRLLICIDEFEGLDWHIGEGHLSPNLPATLRESVQTHRCITWLFAGSHHFSELRHVRWSSFLVSLRTIEMHPFTIAETQMLLTEPLRFSRRVGQENAGKVFGAAFWGEGGMEEVHRQAGGWPHLVQLIASTTIDLCNQRGRDRADADLLEEAVANSVVSGDSVLAELMLYASEEYPEAWAYLRGFRGSDRQHPPEDSALRLVLKRHLLVSETANGQWALCAPLMARWLNERT